MKRMLGLVLACSALAACGAPDPAPQAAAPSPEPSATVVLTDCGTFKLTQGEEPSKSAVQFLLDAVRDKKSAQLKVTRPTVEGDPIPTTYTSGPDGRVEVLTDSRQDAYGADEITRRFCTGPVTTPRLDFTKCSDSVPVAK